MMKVRLFERISIFLTQRINFSPRWGWRQSRGWIGSSVGKKRSGIIHWRQILFWRKNLRLVICFLWNRTVGSNLRLWRDRWRRKKNGSRRWGMVGRGFHLWSRSIAAPYFTLIPISILSRTLIATASGR